MWLSRTGMMGAVSDVATSARHKAVRRLAGGLTLALLLAAAPAHGDVATPPGDPAWWRREPIGEWLPAFSVDDPQFRQILEAMDWLD